MGRRGSKYCEKCGCYLPEGETVCVSCGYDPTAPTLSKCTDWVYPYQFNALLVPKVRSVTIHDIYGRVTPSGE